jgi:hypothetical protein
VELHLVTDANGAQTSWEIRSDVDGYVVRSGPASPYADQADVIETFYLPIGCYRLRVYDSGGDGIVGGGYSLRDQVYGSMFIDNLNNGGFGSSSAIINDGAFCMDVSNDLLILTQRDKETWIIDDQMIAHENGAVSAQWGIGDQTDDGYQFWFFDPNGSYSRRVFRDHATSGGLGPANALRASRLALASIVSQPLPTGLLLNVKVRTKVNGIFGPWGSATRFRLLSTAPMCPMTQLSSTAPYTSCGTVRNLDGSDRVWAVPATRPNGNGGVQVADHYRFQWSLPSEGYLRNIVSASPALILSVWATNPLIPCRMYDVRVQASFDGGLTYCPWGPACQVYIFGSGCGDFQGGDHRAAEVSDVTGPLNLFPNPCAGDRFFITLPKEPEVDGAALVEVLDLAGKLVASRSITIAADLRNYEVTLDRPLGQGVYTARITIAGREQGSIRFGVVR